MGCAGAGGRQPALLPEPACDPSAPWLVAAVFEAFAPALFPFVCTMTGLAPGLSFTTCTAMFTGFACAACACAPAP